MMYNPSCVYLLKNALINSTPKFVIKIVYVKNIIESYSIIVSFPLIFLKVHFKFISLCECFEFLFHLNKGYEMGT
jgi:hypothetical protein